MAKDSSHIPITPNILVTSRMINLMDMDFFNMAINILSETFKMAQCMVMDYGKIRKVKNMWVDGRLTRLMAMEFTLRKTVIIKVNL